MKRVLPLAALGGALIALLKLIEYKHFVHVYPTELYGGLVAVIFTSVGVWVGLRWRRRTDRSAARPAPGAVFAPDLGQLRELGITPREHEILGWIAQGLSNREIGAKLFVSENTVKTHSYRLFGKLGVNRRVQAVQRGRERSLIP